jgi:hypothetical protein
VADGLDEAKAKVLRGEQEMKTPAGMRRARFFRSDHSFCSRRVARLGSLLATALRLGSF